MPDRRKEKTKTIKSEVFGVWFCVISIKRKSPTRLTF
jgi:hypothetical protein